VPLIQTSCPDLKLRPENLHALSLASIDALSGHALLCIDDISPSSPFPSNNFALVDHNRLLPQFSKDNPSARVVAVVDHHDDEGLYQDTASPRVIKVPTGSCTSLVTQLLAESYPEGVPPELATLLLCGILVDTQGLKKGGKAEQVDREAAAFLLPRSTIGQPSEIYPSDLSEVTAVKDLTVILQNKKFAVSDLGARDLLRRDYKEYALQPSWTPGSGPLQVGLATVPLGLADWAHQNDFWPAVEAWMDERELAAIGILTSYHKVKKHAKGKHGEHGNSKGKHKREILFVVKEEEESDLVRRLWAGLESSDVLQLKERGWEKIGTTPRLGNGCAKVWKQQNANATRKQVAPLVKSVIEYSGTS
jgi:exopolyphosphatase